MPAFQSQRDSGRKGAGKARTACLRGTDQQVGAVFQKGNEGFDAVGMVAVVIGNQDKRTLLVHLLQCKFATKVLKKGLFLAYFM